MKRIVICADGTWNTRDQVDDESGKRQPTNVTKVARAILPVGPDGVVQIVGYTEGVGTSGGLDKFTGGAFGEGIEGNIRELYRFIVYNYAPDDELYFFGFSRGAFTVRSLVGFMKLVGLVEKDDDYFVPDLYACYEKGQTPGSKEWANAFRHIAGARPCPPLKFVGVWDTVGALGAPGLLGQLVNKGKYKYHDVGLNDSVQHAYHALAIDERRKPFLPTLWTRPANWKGSLEQVWFAGVHSNVGGGYRPDGLANIALHWMVEKASSHGLAFDENYLNFFKPCFDSVLKDSMSLKYKVFGSGARTLGAYRNEGEALHQSAVSRMGLTALRYAPENLSKVVASGSVNPLAVVGPVVPPCG